MNSYQDYLPPFVEHHLQPHFMTDTTLASSQSLTLPDFLPQNTQRLIPAYLNGLAQQRASQGKRSTPIELTYDSTKRVRHTESTFTENIVKAEDMHEDAGCSMKLLKAEEPYPQIKAAKEELISYEENPSSYLRYDLNKRRQEFLKSVSDLQSRHYVQHPLQKIRDEEAEDWQNSLVLKRNIQDYGLLKDIPQRIHFEKERMVQSEALEKLNEKKFEHYMKQKMYQRAQQQWLEQLERKKIEQQREQIAQQMQQQHLNSFLQQKTLQRQRQEQMAFGPQGTDVCSDKDISSFDPEFLAYAKKLYSEQMHALKFKHHPAQIPKLEPNSPIVHKIEDDHQHYLKVEQSTQKYPPFSAFYNIKPQMQEMNFQTIFSKKDESLNKKYADESKKLNGVSPKQAKQASKKKSSSSANSSYMDMLLAKELAKKERLGPRRKNKWQRIVDGQPEEPEDIASAQLSEALQAAAAAAKEEAKKAKAHKLKEEVEDDIGKDFEYLLSISITKNNSKSGPSNSLGGFIVKSLYDKDPETGEKGELKPKSIHVGPGSQAMVLPINSNGLYSYHRSKRRPELVWNPKSVPENDIETYFTDLGKILNNENVNQERALKLLKRKNYKKEKVKTNISKNEKFYSSFLVVSEVPKENPMCQEEQPSENGSQKNVDAVQPENIIEEPQNKTVNDTDFEAITEEAPKEAVSEVEAENVSDATSTVDVSGAQQNNASEDQKVILTDQL